MRPDQVKVGEPIAIMVAERGKQKVVVSAIGSPSFINLPTTGVDLVATPSVNLMAVGVDSVATPPSSPNHGLYQALAGLRPAIATIEGPSSVLPWPTSRGTTLSHAMAASISILPWPSLTSARASLDITYHGRCPLLRGLAPPHHGCRQAPCFTLP